MFCVHYNNDNVSLHVCGWQISLQLITKLWHFLNLKFFICTLCTECTLSMYDVCLATPERKREMEGGRERSI